MKKPIPNIGQHWDEEGGIFVGTYRHIDHARHLILPTEQEAKIIAPWGEFGKLIEGEFSKFDGEHNTNLIIAGEPENKIANHFKSLTLNGHRDYFFAAQKQQMLCYINAPDIFEDGVYWNSTQYSAYGAWIQNFENGRQDLSYKDLKLAARAVRSILAIK